ncbi:alpha/beta hydrolase [Nonomuraea longicatena]
MQASFVFMHSPCVGPSTWAPVAEVVRRSGTTAVVPDLTRVGSGPAPHWPAVVAAVRAAAPADGPLVLVAHSNAGLFVPVVKEALGGRVVACVFAESRVPPRGGLTEIAEEPFLPFLRALAGPDDILPPWTGWWGDEEVAAFLPDAAMRRRVEADQPRLPLSYFTQRVPVPAGWENVPCAFVWYGEPYDGDAREAKDRGWPVSRVPGRHLHQVVDPEAVGAELLEVVNSSLFPRRRAPEASPM